MNLLIPTTCAGCDRWDTRLCDQCRAELHATAQPFCLHEENWLYAAALQTGVDSQRVTSLSASAGRSSGHLGIGQSEAEGTVTQIDGWCVGAYRGRLRKLIINAKHRPEVRLEEELAQAGYGLAKTLLTESKFAVAPGEGPVKVEIVAMPSGFSRYWKGMLLTPAIAAGVSFALNEVGVPAEATYPLRLRHQWRSQAGRSGRQRRLQREHAMEATSAMRTHVVLVDDVVTTGATMLEAARVCRQAGAEHLWALALAQVR